jgi:hypothetical protein
VYERTRDDYVRRLIELSNELLDDWIEFKDDPKPSRAAMEKYIELYLKEYEADIPAATVVTVPRYECEDYIPIDDAPRWMMWGAHKTYAMRQFVLPTEVVIRKWGEVIMPDIGRAWECGVLCVKGEPEKGSVTYYDANSSRMLQWLDIPFERVCIKEEWWDGGDDGHTSYRLMGLRIIQSADFETL